MKKHGMKVTLYSASSLLCYTFSTMFPVCSCRKTKYYTESIPTRLFLLRRQALDAQGELNANVDIAGYYTLVSR